MAFELAAIDPTCVPINLLNPRPGTKFGDRDYMDPWEAVKWIAIFRLILPDALFRLCGGRVENLGELQPLAVKAGVNGVMMGNFLTTLGNDARARTARCSRSSASTSPASPTTAPTRARTTAPAGSRARRPTSSSEPRRDRAGGRGPPVGPVDPAALPQEALGAAAPRRRAEHAGSAPEPAEEGPTMRHRRTAWTSSSELGLYRRMRMVSGPQGPRVRARRQARAAAVLEQLPRPRRPPARARGGRRRGDALGRRRRARRGSCREHR